MHLSNPADKNHGLKQFDFNDHVIFVATSSLLRQTAELSPFIVVLIFTLLLHGDSFNAAHVSPWRSLKTPLKY